MAKVQPQFDKFDEAIRLGQFDENEVLRDKRDIIRNKLKERLPDVFKKHGEECPPYQPYDQGSYSIGTGVKPLDGDFDIDQGLYFDMATTAYPDPVVLKERVFEALDGHTKDVQLRRSCVTVFYQREGEPIYHVDLAVFSDGAQNSDGKDRLAKGKRNSAPEHREWVVSKPGDLTETIWNKFKGTDRDQFRRVVRSLKRWRDENFSNKGNAAPIGIGLTVATYDRLQPAYSDATMGTPDDLQALRDLVRATLWRFAPVWDQDEQRVVRRLAVTLPVEPWTDVFERMTGKQMEDFENKLKQLLGALDAAATDIDPHEACKTLQRVFGPDFPVPPKEETAKRHAPAIVSSSNSA